MTIRPVAEGFAVAPQIAPADLPRLRELGFRAVICTRPDGEEAGQPAFAAIAAAARAAGLEARHIPVSGFPGAAEAAAMARALAELPGPLLGYCRSGARAATLHAAARAAGPARARAAG